MTKSKKSAGLAAYRDVKIIMDLAVENAGMTYELSTSGRAMNFKQRCNMYRNLLRAQDADTYSHIPGYRSELAYDVLVIRQINETGKSDREGKILQFDHANVSGVVRRSDGTEIDLSAFEGLDMPELTEDARESREEQPFSGPLSLNVNKE